MSLTSLWKSQQNELSEKHIQAMIGLAGDGKLRDGGIACTEFRDFLTHVPSSLLARYANECLSTEKFSEASAALQDVINEVGRRLGFAVENGLYRGKVNNIGHDGLWRSEDKSAILLEVKTTDTYTIDLDTLADYRGSLAAAKKLDIEKSSILIVVGRSDTGSWEAQVRGSRHAWDIRMISVDALLRLVTVKEEIEDPQTVEKIREILCPREFTKVDAIIDLVFSAATDVSEAESPELDQFHEESGPETLEKKGKAHFAEDCIARLQLQFGALLVKRSPALFSTADNSLGIICLVSKKHKTARRYPSCWFIFRAHQRDAIMTFKEAYIAFGCGGAHTMLLLPAKAFIDWIDNGIFWSSQQRNGVTWHINMEVGTSKITVETKSGSKDLTEYLVKKRAA